MRKLGTTLIILSSLSAFSCTAQAERDSNDAIKTLAVNQTAMPSPSPSKNPTPSYKRKRVKLSQMPVEIRVALAPDYNYQEKPSGGFRWKAEDPKWAEEYDFEEEDRDINHDGVNEKLLIYLDKTVRGLEPSMLHIFKQENGKWIDISPEKSSIDDNFEIILADKENEFDTFKVDAGEIVFYYRMKNGRYDKSECRDADNKVIDCVLPPPQVNMPIIKE